MDADDDDLWKEEENAGQEESRYCLCYYLVEEASPALFSFVVAQKIAD